MKTVRIWFRKIGSARYISHLDLQRCFRRAIHRAKIPLWYTQGFNPRAFMTFALPLSLGYSGDRECFDIKLDDGAQMTTEELIQKLNAGLPNDIPVIDVTEPIMKPGEISWASFVISIDPEGNGSGYIRGALESLLKKSSIIVPKHTKSGFVDFDIKPHLDHIKIREEEGLVQIEALLPADSNMNLNPGLILEAFQRETGLDLYVEIRRTGLYNKDFEKFQ